MVKKLIWNGIKILKVVRVSLYFCNLELVLFKSKFKYSNNVGTIHMFQ